MFIKVSYTGVCTCMIFPFTSNRCKFLPSHSKHQSITTQASEVGHESKQAFELFLSTLKEGHGSVKEMCSIYIEKLCRSGKLRDAMYLLRHLHSRQISLSSNTYNTLLIAAYEADDFDISSNIFKYLLLSSSPPGTTSYISLAKAIQKVTDSGPLLRFAREVSEITNHRDPTVMNRIIFILAKLGQINTALLMFEDMKNQKYKMDTVTFNVALVILGKDGQVDRMLSEFTLMKVLGHTPDIVTYNTLINCLRRLGRLDLCSVFVREMSEKLIERDLRTYTAIMDGFGRAGHVEEALRVFDDMKKSRVRPSIYVYRALISDFKKAGKLDVANSFSEEMKSNSYKIVGPEDLK